MAKASPVSGGAFCFNRQLKIYFFKIAFHIIFFLNIVLRNLSL